MGLCIISMPVGYKLSCRAAFGIGAAALVAPAIARVQTLRWHMVICWLENHIDRGNFASSMVERMNAMIGGRHQGGGVVGQRRLKICSLQEVGYADVHNRMWTAREEIFGPVLSILPYADEAQALAIANDTAFGLASYITSADPERARRLAPRLRAGMLHLNGAPSDPAAPFGGYRHSGNGRERGVFGLEAFIEVKAIFGFGLA